MFITIYIVIIYDLSKYSSKKILFQDSVHIIFLYLGIIQDMTINYRFFSTKKH